MAGRVQSTEAPVAREQWLRRVNDACVLLDVQPYPDSITVSDRMAVALVRRTADKHLLMMTENDAVRSDFRGTPCRVQLPGNSVRAKLCPLSPENAQQLRDHIPFLAPIVPNTALSFGLGDRLGLATPGHICSIRGRNITPVLAQQSIREMLRTRRGPHDVISSATWGALQMGYRGGYAADADHLRTIEDISFTLGAGFSMYTVDPGAHVDASAERAEASDLVARAEALPWKALETTLGDCRRRYGDRTVTVRGHRDTFSLHVTADDALRVMCKYGRAIAHTATLYRYLVGQRARNQFMFEISVDETDSPTSAAEHFCVASELKRLGVQWDSLAPRLIGSFHKGVDYVGDLGQFRAGFRQHALIAEHFGTYKLSLHSGSDKFTIYPIIAELTGGRMHIKTSGTSYVEALRVVAAAAPDLFREIVAFAKQCYAEDRAEYHVGGDRGAVPDPYSLRDAELPDIMDQRDTRQVCHVTFGSILTSQRADGRFRFRQRLLTVLEQNEEAYYRRLEQHFSRHLRPFL